MYNAAGIGQTYPSLSADFATHRRGGSLTSGGGGGGGCLPIGRPTFLKKNVYIFFKKWLLEREFQWGRNWIQ